jgi:hypothetical protein
VSMGVSKNLIWARNRHTNALRSAVRGYARCQPRTRILPTEVAAVGFESCQRYDRCRKLGCQQVVAGDRSFGSRM